MDERQQPQDGWSYGEQTPSSSEFPSQQDNYGMMPYMSQGYGYSGHPGMMPGGMPSMGGPSMQGGMGQGMPGGQMMPGMQGQPLPPQQQNQQFQPLPANQQSYIENILRMNLGKTATVYCTFENNREWNAKVFHGEVEAAGIDHVIIKDNKTGTRYLILMVYVDYITFQGPINYYYPYG